MKIKIYLLANYYISDCAGRGVFLKLHEDVLEVSLSWGGETPQKMFKRIQNSWRENLSFIRSCRKDLEVFVISELAMWTRSK